MKIREIRDTLVRSQRIESLYSGVWTEFMEYPVKRQGSFFDMMGCSIFDDEDCYVRICFEI